MKPTITKEQAEAIEVLRGGRNKWSDNDFLIAHVLYGCGKSYKWSDFKPIENMDLMTLATALINGYEVEKTPEEKVREYFEKLWADYCDTNEIEIAKETIINTLDLLGIKIEGVNA
ncbi:hypothetical protein P5661_06340 [Bacillus subtilis]|uniref:hypothetical protein n=1 Tax=Bacillus subtilis TaxID=1423 RepID=UPI00240DE9D2|nr:hypothetical protein [Bacillus subtilis]WEZ21193.1 hypothetical protein P5661_06340 [Bacillus subtilis]